jgi:thioredoxin 1
MQDTDLYYYENGYRVFTEKAHLKRGTCCGCKCRHCPFHPQHVKNTKTTKNMKIKILYFSADWCLPCQQMKPKVAAFANENQDRVDVEHINIESDSSLTKQYEVKSIPTFVFLKDDVEINRIYGVQPISKFSDILDQYQ